MIFDGGVTCYCNINGLITNTIDYRLQLIFNPGKMYLEDNGYIGRRQF